MRHWNVPIDLKRSATLSQPLVLTALLAGDAWADTAQDIADTGQRPDGPSDITFLSRQTACQPLVIEGTARSKGFIGKFFIATDPSRWLATLQVTDAGPADFAFGVANSRAWVRDANGAVNDADFEGFREGIVSDAYWLSGGIADRCWPAKISVERTEQTGGVTADVLNVRPQGGKPTPAWVSRVTHLPLRWSRRDEPDVASTTYSNYRRVGDRFIPFRQRMVDRDGN